MQNRRIWERESEGGDLPPQTLAETMAEVLACSWVSLSVMIMWRELYGFVKFQCE